MCVTFHLPGAAAVTAAAAAAAATAAAAAGFRDRLSVRPDGVVTLMGFFSPGRHPAIRASCYTSPYLTLSVCWWSAQTGVIVFFHLRLYLYSVK